MRQFITELADQIRLDPEHTKLEEEQLWELEQCIELRLLAKSAETTDRFEKGPRDTAFPLRENSEKL